MRDRLFRFFQWNDFHIRNRDVPRRNEGYPNCNEKAAWAVECARGETETEAPDFIASVGDLICGEIDDYADDFRFMRSHLLDPLSVPVLPCLGNHENRQGEGIRELNEAYDAFFGTGWHNYVYTLGGIAFIVLDTSGGHRDPDAVTAERNAFLERAFEYAADKPVFVLSHVPLISMREAPILEKSFGFSSWKVRDGRALQIVESHAHQVIAVLCGHIHITGSVHRNGVHHIMPSGTAGYPADFAAFDVYPDRIEIEMVRAPSDLIEDTSAGNIHGAHRHGIDYTDSAHPDHESYLSGNPGERQFTIPLDGARSIPLTTTRELSVFHEASPGRWQEAQVVKLPSPRRP